jgi:hypothetical protein
VVIHKSDVKEGGDILVGHGLILTPSLLLDKKLSLDEGRLLDFCTLVNALKRGPFDPNHDDPGDSGGSSDDN